MQINIAPSVCYMRFVGRLYSFVISNFILESISLYTSLSLIFGHLHLVNVFK